MPSQKRCNYWQRPLRHVRGGGEVITIQGTKDRISFVKEHLRIGIITCFSIKQCHINIFFEYLMPMLRLPQAMLPKKLPLTLRITRTGRDLLCSSVFPWEHIQERTILRLINRYIRYIRSAVARTRNHRTIHHGTNRLTIWCPRTTITAIKITLTERRIKIIHNESTIRRIVWALISCIPSIHHQY